LSTAFGGRNKKRLNRVFDAIGFIYRDYSYPLCGQGKKRKIAASVITLEPKGKKVKVLTHRPHYIEPTVIPEFGKGTSLAAEAKETVPIVQSAEEPTIVPKVPTVWPAEAKDDKVEEPHVERVIEMPEILSPPAAADLPKMHRAPVATPKRRRMASVLDTVIETTKALSPAPKKIAEGTKVQDVTEAGPSAPIETKAVAPEDKVDPQASDVGMGEGTDAGERARSPAPEAIVEDADYIYRHASGKKWSEEEVVEARHYARKLKYPKGALVFNGSNDDDFLYCLLDNKEIFVCREIAKSMGFPKLEDGLSILSKDDLADSLEYNSIKV
jgi:hypothetical protein